MHTGTRHTGRPVVDILRDEPFFDHGDDFFAWKSVSNHVLDYILQIIVRNLLASLAFFIESFDSFGFFHPPSPRGTFDESFAAY